MTEAMKHRMVGLAVLVALGVILWPVLFDASPVREISQRSQIPTAPAVDRFAIQEPRQPDLPPEPDGVPGTLPGVTEPVTDGPAGVPEPEPDASDAPVQPPTGAEEPASTPAARTSSSPAASQLAPAKPAPTVARPATKPAVTSTKPPRAEQDKYGLPVQWAVQLGVFSRIEGARDIKQRAEGKGFHTVMQTIPGKTGTQYRVVVGPKLDRKSTEQLQRDIKQKLGVEGYVTRYTP